MRSATWLALGKVGTAFAQVVASEWQTLRSEMRHSARLSAGAIVTLAVAMAFLVVALAGLMFAAVEALTGALPRWVAFLIVALAMGAVGLLLVLRARSQLRQAETPKQVIKRRWQDHRGWMRRRLKGDGGEADD